MTCCLPIFPGPGRKNDLVGVERFELPTSCSQSRRATRLRYTPYYRLGLQGRESYVVPAPASTRQRASHKENPPFLDFLIVQQSNEPSCYSACSRKSTDVPETHAFFHEYRSYRAIHREWRGFTCLPRRMPAQLPLASTCSGIH